MSRVLIVDDEADILELLSYNLAREGFSVDTASDGDRALEVLRRGGIDLIVLDLMLPGISGIDLCKLIRAESGIAGVPILMLTAKGEEIDKIVGLEVGADDYMTKPFSPRELIARIKAILRRALYQDKQVQGSNSGTGVLKISNLVIDREKYTVQAGERDIVLSVTEFKLLLYLAERPKRIFGRESLLDAVWGTDVYIEPRTVDVHISRLRAKLEDDPDNPVHIKTMRGAGYFFEE